MWSATRHPMPILPPIPPGFTEETWAVVERYAVLIEWYTGQGFELGEAEAKAKAAMRVENATRRLINES